MQLGDGLAIDRPSDLPFGQWFDNKPMPFELVADQPINGGIGQAGLLQFMVTPANVRWGRFVVESEHLVYQSLRLNGS